MNVINRLTDQRIANLLGAASLSVADRLRGIAATEGISPIGTAVLLHLDRSPGCTEAALPNPLGLSRPGHRSSSGLLDGGSQPDGCMQALSLIDISEGSEAAGAAQLGHRTPTGCTPIGRRVALGPGLRRCCSRRNVG